MVCVCTGYSYHIYMSYRSPINVIYYSTFFLSILCYIYARIVSQYSIKTSVYMHALMHIIGNISNFILYSGEIQ